jgi:glucokinase
VSGDEVAVGETAGGTVGPRPRAGPLAIGLDVGGTKIGGGVVTRNGEILDREQVPTPGSARDETLEAMLHVIEALRARNPGVSAVGAGAAGLVEWPEGRARYAPHNAYPEGSLRRMLTERTGLPSIVDNDANMAAWAEARYGAGRGSDHLVLLTLGTGVGSGLVLDGRVYRGSTGIGAEFGHVTVDAEGGARCGCGNIGCLEAVASGSALGRYGREAAVADPDGLIATLAGSPDRVTGVVVFEAARQGDPTAIALFGQVGRWLGIGVASAVTLFDPQVVVIGGGLGRASELLLAPARASMEEFVFGRRFRTLPPLVPAGLGPDAGVVGAATLALEPEP